MHKMFKIIRLSLLLLLISACSEKPPELDLPANDNISNYYPVGIYTPKSSKAQWQIVSRYQGRAISIYLPKGEGPFPALVFMHGRPFKMPTNNPYYPYDYLVDAAIDQGYALIVPIRSGYFGDQRSDGEKIPCNQPSYSDFKRAGQSARSDVSQALQYIRSLPFIDGNQIVLAGNSAGGFAVINSLQLVDHMVKAAVSINGGRCGKQGKVIGGLNYMKMRYEQLVNNTSTPVYFLAGTADTVIPEYSTEQLYKSFCSARGDCESATFFRSVKNASHDTRTMLDAITAVLSEQLN